jgi:hypothetical protein
MFCRSLFVFLYFFFWPLRCLSDSPCYLMTINNTCNYIAILRAICTVCSFTASDYPFWYFQTCLLYMDVLLPTRPEHLSSPLVFSGVRVTRSLVLSVCFVDRSLSVCTFSFGHCVVCSSAINPVVSSNSSFSIKEIICFTFYSKIQISAMTTDTFWISNHGLWKMSHSLDNPDIVISFSFSDNHFLLCLFLMSVFHKQTLSRCAGYLYRKVYKL